MPASRASRGDPNVTGVPSTASVPSSGGCTPDRVLIRVDLPAPLSPSRQLISPARTSRLTPSSATTAPKYFEMFRASSRGAADGGRAEVAGPTASLIVMRGLLSEPGEAAPDPVVQDDSGQQQGARRDLVPVGVDVREHDPDLRHPQGERAQRRPDDRSVAAGQEAAADDRRRDRGELQAATAEDVGRAEAHRLDGG